MSTTLLGLGVALAIAMVPAAHAAQFSVNTGGDSLDEIPGDGICGTLANPANSCALRAAIQEANAGAELDTILLPAGTYLLTLPGADEDAAASGDLDVTAPLNIVGAAAETSSIEQTGADRVFDIGTGVAAGLSRVAIRYGGSVEAGGGVRNMGILAMQDCVVESNGGNTRPVRLGGGVFNGATLAITACRLSDNQAGGAGLLGASGGALYNGLASALSATRLTLNRAVGTGATGGGVSNVEPGVLQITLSELSGNSAVQGGGVLAAGGTVNIGSSLLAENTASGAGGALRVVAGTATVVNSTLSGNAANGDGGGASCAGGSVDLRNVTLSANLADADANGSGNGGALAIANAVATSARNSILADNIDRGGQAPDCSGTLNSAGQVLLKTSVGCVLIAGGGDLVGSDPGLATLADNGGQTRSQALPLGSPALDAGAASGCSGFADTPLLTDQRGEARTRDGDSDGKAVCDLGAYEARGDLIYADGFDP